MKQEMALDYRNQYLGRPIIDDIFNDLFVLKGKYSSTNVFNYVVTEPKDGFSQKSDLFYNVVAFTKIKDLRESQQVEEG